jgi:hypothetical protein
MALVVRELTADLWPALEDLFSATGPVGRSATGHTLLRRRHCGRLVSAHAARRNARARSHLAAPTSRRRAVVVDLMVAGPQERPQTCARTCASRVDFGLIESSASDYDWGCSARACRARIDLHQARAPI